MLELAVAKAVAIAMQMILRVDHTTSRAHDLPKRGGAAPDWSGKHELTAIVANVVVVAATRETIELAIAERMQLAPVNRLL